MAWQGLGINRGFLHVLDCAELVKGYAKVMAKDGSHASRPALTQLCERREGLFNVTKKISGHNRDGPHFKPLSVALARSHPTPVAAAGLTELKPHTDKQNRLAYHHDPRSRYVNLPAGLPPLPV